nr:uncharacterized protein LOC122173882 [Chrysemys picta bellii]
MNLTVSPAQQARIAHLQHCPSHRGFATPAITAPREPSTQPPSDTRWNLLAYLCLEMTSALLGISAPVAQAILCPALLEPTPPPWAWEQRSSASPAQRDSTAARQDCLICPRHRRVVQGMFVMKETLLPALPMGFMVTNAPVVSTVLLAPDWRYPVSQALSALCLEQAPASLARLVWPADMLPLWSQSAAPEVTIVQLGLQCPCHALKVP